MTARSSARSPLRLALLGDSVAFGRGADRTDDTIAPRLQADLESAGIAATSRVFAWSGARSADLRRQVERALPWHPDVVVVIIGANDLTHQVPAAQAAEHLRQAVRALTAAGAEVVLAPAPDLSVVPHVPPAFRAFVRSRCVELRRAQIAVGAAEDAVIADADAATSDLFGADRTLFSRDGFHPSSAGYARIAVALVPSVRAAALRRAAAPGPSDGPRR